MTSVLQCEAGGCGGRGRYDDSAVLFDSGNLFRCMEGGEDFDVLQDAVLVCDVPRGPK